MRWKFVAGACLAAAAVPTAASAQMAAPRYSSLTVFGDSLVDAGNIRSLGLGADPAQGYFMGRFTNGYDYTDLLSQRMYGTVTTASLQGGTNFAFGGARATTTSGVPDALEQVGLYNLYLAGGGRVDATGLYVLNFGGNDVFAAQAAGAPIGFASDSAFLQAAATNYASSVQALNNLGVRNFFVTGFPVATGPGLSLSIEAEGYLTTALGNLSLASGTNVYRYSYLDFFGRLQADPGAFGLDGLILPDRANPTGTVCQLAGAVPACPNFFSFDGTHPTAAVQRALFNDIEAQFNLSGAVPEPASWAMLMIGFGMIGGALRVRRRGVVVMA